MANGEKCNNTNCKTIVTEIRKKDGQYKKYCSISCQRLSVSEKIKITSLMRYGVSNPSKSNEIKDRIKESFTEKYGEGVSNAMDLKEFRDKIVETNIERHGTNRPQLLEKFQEKTKQTNLEKFGTEIPQQLQKLKDKSKETCIERYGVSAPQQNKDVRKKSIDTCLKKYGVSNVSKLVSTWDSIRTTCMEKYGVESSNQDPDVHRKQDGSRYRNKEYIYEDGKSIMLQGYEPWAVDTLVSYGYLSSDIETETKYMPKITYVENGIKRRYFPDIFIENENTIIEVKSTYTYELTKERNLLKRQACIDAGYNFKFMIFDKGGNLLEDK